MQWWTMSADDQERAVARTALPMRAFSESLPMALLRTRESVMRLFRPGLRGQGVTEQQWRILRALAHSGPMEVTGLAEATFLLGPSLSRILPDMEERQLVSRTQVDSDLRRSMVSIEPRGLRLIARHAPESETIYAEIARRFGDERLGQLFTLLHELQDSLADLSRESASGLQRQSRTTGVRARVRGAGPPPMDGGPGCGSRDGITRRPKRAGR
jgi:homoprotocatechuate degradation regulator HpaR